MVLLLSVSRKCLEPVNFYHDVRSGLKYPIALLISHFFLLVDTGKRKRTYSRTGNCHQRDPVTLAKVASKLVI